MLRSVRFAGILVAVLGASAVMSAQAATDPADIAYWQSVQNSKNPAEYKAYLSAFPHGAFSGLAQARINELGGGGMAANGGGNNAPAMGNVVGKGVVTINPAAPQVGDRLKLSFAKFPHLTGYDMVVVVSAGTPDSASAAGSILWYTYLNDQNIESGIDCGPFAPGSYEVRWLTQLYNNQNKYQVGARTPFTVGD
jgi:hypothetical protein